MRTIVCVLMVLSLAGCRRWEEPSFEETHALRNVTLGELREYYHGEAELTIADDIELSGRVVSSDRAGNFYNTFFIDDGTGSAEIMVGMPDLDAAYRPGQRVSIRARGLAVGWRDGVMQIGLPPEPGNRFATSYFYHPVVMGAYVTAERSVEEVEPIEVSLDEISVELCGRPVRISGLVAEDGQAGATWAQTLPEPVTGYVRFRTAASEPDGGSITVVTSGYASFAPAPVPKGEVTLTGILFYGLGGTSREQFLLKLRDENDIAY
jgi:hypothetical protein